MRELLKKLGITQTGNYGEGNAYIIDIDNDTEWGKFYSRLENSEELYQLEENSFLTNHNSSLIYMYEEEYQLNLLADFDADTYKLVITEI